MDEVFDDFVFAGLAIGVGGSAPDLAEFRDGIFLRAFAGTGVTVEQGWFSIHFLHGVKPGSTPTLHVHWTHNNASPSGNVKWLVDYSLREGYGVGAFEAPTTCSAIQAAGGQYFHHITNDDDMPLASNVEPDAVMIGRVYRDPADSEDTFEDDAFLLHMDVHYLRSRVGTVERNRPFDSSGW